MDSIILVGGGGHCKSVIDVLETEGVYSIEGIVDRKAENCSSVLGYPILGKDEDLPDLIRIFPNALVTVGQIRSANLRMALYFKLKEIGAIIPIVESPRSHVSKYAELHNGTIIMHGAIINPGAVIGENCIINSQALVEHDASVESHCHISTGAKVNGSVHIGSESFIGSGAVIHEGIRIGNRCVIAAGSVVRKDLQPETKYLET